MAGLNRLQPLVSIVQVVAGELHHFHFVVPWSMPVMIVPSEVTCNEPPQAFCGNLAATPPEALRGTLLAGASDVYGQNPGVKR